MSFRIVYGYKYSENGWRMCNRDECVLVAGPFMNTAPLRRGAAEIILGDFVRRYHAEVAPVVSAVWGWSNENDVGNSNHLAGTAVDINAPQWPWGVRKMPAVLVDKINRLVSSYGGAVFWGRNWNKPDEMHFQLGWAEGDPRFNAVIDKILGRNQTPPPNAIEEAYKAAPWMGKKLTKEVELPTPDGRGRFAAYENGHIYWTPTTGARPIPKLLFEVYAKLGYETGPLGYPTRFFTVIPDAGDIQAFEGGVLYRKYGAADGFYVHGAIGNRYARQGYEAGALGWPTSNETPFNGGAYQDFENGRLLWAPDGVVAVQRPAEVIPESR